MKNFIEDIKKLGFGLMRLPTVEGEIDAAQLNQMVDAFLGAGFNYFDTAYGYHGGKSETAIGEALVRRHPRESFYLATKLPVWAAKTPEDARQMLFTSLERTGAGYFDLYLMHNMGGDRTEMFERFGIWDFLKEQKEKGVVRHYGFSFHDSADELDKLLTKHPEAEFVQLQINYADWKDPRIQSGRCYEAARAHGKPVIVMEPVKGGSLASVPESALSILAEAGEGKTPVSLALRFAASLPGVLTVLSGMSSLEQMRENILTMRDMKPLDDGERDIVTRAGDAIAEVPRIPCTDCRYCMKGCPKQVRIAPAFDAMNSYLIYGIKSAAKHSYGFATRDGGKASECIACGECEAVCPQQIHIIDELKRVAEALE